MEHNTDKETMELISAAKNGDDDAFSRLVGQYKPLFYGVMRDFSLDEADAFSELCLGFERAVKSYEVVYGTTFGLYAKIWLERFAQGIRSRHFQVKDHVVDQDIDVDNIAVPGGIQLMLEHRERSAYFLSVAKAVLSELELKVYRYWMLGYTTSETASALGVSAKTVDNAKNRMWRKLREHLRPED